MISLSSTYCKLIFSYQKVRKIFMVSNLVIISYFEPILNFNDELREVDIVDAVVIIGCRECTIQDDVLIR